MNESRSALTWSSSVVHMPHLHDDRIRRPVPSRFASRPRIITQRARFETGSRSPIRGSAGGDTDVMPAVPVAAPPERERFRERSLTALLVGLVLLIFAVTPLVEQGVIG